jgi:hypothetical protein
MWTNDVKTWLEKLLDASKAGVTRRGETVGEITW